jgi:cytochrome c
LAAGLSLASRSDAAGIDSRDQAPRDVRRSSVASERHSGGQMPSAIDLKTLGPTQQVAAIRYANDTYHVTTAAGATIAFREFDLRFKTDSSVNGPAQGRPVLLPARMRTDRALLVFANAREIGAFLGRGGAL